MARVQTISGTSVPRSPLGIKADAGRAAAGDYANIQMAGAMQQTARVLEGISMQRQAHIDRGLLASEDTIRNKTAAEVQTYMDNNQGTPEAWGDFHKQTWKAYEDGRATRSKDWSPRLKQEDDIQLEDFRSVSGINFATKQNTALIRQANARLEANADTRLDNGDVQGAVDSVRKMNLTEPQRIQKLDQITDGAVKRQYGMRFEGVQNLSPAFRVEELKRIESELMDRTKEGEYIGGKIVDEQTGQVIGGASEGTRLDLIRATRQMHQAAQIDMAQNGRAILRGVEAGDDPALAFKKANEAGLIDDQTAAAMVPEVKERLDAKNAALATKRDKSAAQAETAINRKLGANITVQDIERRVVLGATRPNDPQALTPEAGNRLKDELLAVQASEWELLRDEGTINRELDALAGSSFLPRSMRDSSQIDPVKQQELLGRIADAKLSKGVKAELLNKFFYGSTYGPRRS